MKKFVDATLKGWEYTAKNQAEALEFTNKYIVSESYQDDNYNKFILEQSLPLISLSDDNNIGHMEYVRWKSTYDVMLSDGVIKGEFSPNDIFTLEFID